MGLLHTLAWMGVLFMVLELATGVHSKKQKTPTGPLLLSVIVPRWRVWHFLRDSLAVFVVVGSLCMLLARWTWTAAFDSCESWAIGDMLLFSFAILALRLCEPRRAFAPAALEI